jgi:hypothetical protein
MDNVSVRLPTIRWSSRFCIPSTHASGVWRTCGSYAKGRVTPKFSYALGGSAALDQLCHPMCCSLQEFQECTLHRSRGASYLPIMFTRPQMRIVERVYGVPTEGSCTSCSESFKSGWDQGISAYEGENRLQTLFERHIQEKHDAPERRMTDRRR